MNKILVIEDNKVVRENISEILTLSGYEVSQAENGVEGIKKARELTPNLILCDVMMPELDGFGVLKILNKDKALYRIPFMFLTARTEKSDFRKGMGLGADDYITKPFDDVELLKAIEMRISKSQRSNHGGGLPGKLDYFNNEGHIEAQFQSLVKNMESRYFDRRSLIYTEIQHPRWVYYVEEGAVKIVRTNDNGKELITNICASGEFFGFSNVITNNTYSDSAVSLMETEIKLIPIKDFIKFVFSTTELSMKFISMMSDVIAKHEDDLLHYAYSSVRKRLARALILLNHKQDGKDIPVSREELASLAGIAKETTIRTLSDFKQEGLVKIEAKNIKILELSKLKNMPD